MKRYTFRLGQVLRVRIIERDRAVGEVARARADLARAERRTAEAERLYHEMPPPRSDTAAELTTQMRVRGLVVDAIAAARAAQAQQAELLELRLAEWTDKDQKVRLLEELDQRSRQRHQLEVLATEQRELDDLVTSRHAGAAAEHASGAAS